MCSLSSSCEDDEAFLTENCRNCFNLGNRVVTMYKEKGDREGKEAVNSSLDSIDMSSKSDIKRDLDIKNTFEEVKKCPIAQRDAKENNTSEEKFVENVSITYDTTIQEEDGKTKMVAYANKKEDDGNTKIVDKASINEESASINKEGARINEEEVSNNSFNIASIKQKYVTTKNVENACAKEDDDSAYDIDYASINENDDKAKYIDNGSIDNDIDNTKHDDNANKTEKNDNINAASNLLIPVCIASLAVAIPLAIYMAR